ncbi:hypothetical protein T12_1926 [Trichinella patagoniensis]|uniref:Uncharacterized protein n=1 Tax=Trichinella patagoniensis TaxID=990121 RepID=A0A0V1A1E2_9BILA|nr:hypothetical protein T12_1926 [Trichinella patagoniensis]
MKHCVPKPRQERNYHSYTTLKGRRRGWRAAGGRRECDAVTAVGPMKFANDDNEYLHIMPTNGMRLSASRWTNEICF